MRYVKIADLIEAERRLDEAVKELDACTVDDDGASFQEYNNHTRTLVVSPVFFERRELLGAAVERRYSELLSLRREFVAPGIAKPTIGGI